MYGEMGSPLKRALLAILARDQGEIITHSLAPFSPEGDVALIVGDDSKEGVMLEQVGL